MSKIAKNFSYGFRFRPDFNTKQIIFEIYKGHDKSITQGVNNRVIFSEMYDNLNSAIYTENSQSFKTKVYVGGQGEGSDRTWVEVGVGSGLDLREDTVNASDVSSEDITQSEYEAALTQRGLEYLEKRCNEDMKLAIAMYPTSLDELMAVADSGNVMPPKSTWFEPKLRSGLLIHKI